MKGVRYNTIFWGFVVLWFLALFTGSIYSPPSSISDPGLGFLDLINFSEGGRFMYHQEPSLTDPAVCVETKTTWWSPGQWFFVYLFTLPGFPLGQAISITVLFAAFLGVTGWIKLYRRFQFEESTVLYAGLFILFSRYLFSSFQIYPGANILEFAAAPWLLLLWLWLEQKSFWLQLLCLLPLLIGSYFIKSSMLIFWLGIVGSCVSVFGLRDIPWKRLLLLLALFFTGKLCCDLLFTSGGATPFSYPGVWFGIHAGNSALLLQHLLFTFSAPFLGTIGAEDYVRYFFQKPGAVIFQNGHWAMVLMYAVAFVFFLFLIRYFIRQRSMLNQRYVNLAVSVTGVFVIFFLYTYVSGKNINGYEESRHMRLAGLVLLPFLVQWLQLLLKRFLFVLLLVMFGYAVLSSANKIGQEKIISEKYKVPLSEINSLNDYRSFLDAAKRSDLVYVVHAGIKYELEHCKTIYYQDDFITLDIIKARTKTVINQKTVLFLLPERFAANGKKEAILANFIPAPGAGNPKVSERRLGSNALITVTYY